MARRPTTFKGRVKFYFEDFKTPMGKFVDMLIIFLIILACLTFVIQTYPLSPSITSILLGIEFVIGIFFTVEYILRVWVAEKKN